MCNGVVIVEVVLAKILLQRSKLTRRFQNGLMYLEVQTAHEGLPEHQHESEIQAHDQKTNRFWPEVGPKCEAH